MNAGRNGFNICLLITNITQIGHKQLANILDYN